MDLLPDALLRDHFPVDLEKVVRLLGHPDGDVGVRFSQDRTRRGREDLRRRIHILDLHLQGRRRGTRGGAEGVHLACWLFLALRQRDLHSILRNEPEIPSCRTPEGYGDELRTPVAGEGVGKRDRNVPPGEAVPVELEDVLPRTDAVDGKFPLSVGQDKGPVLEIQPDVLDSRLVLPRHPVAVAVHENAPHDDRLAVQGAFLHLDARPRRPPPEKVPPRGGPGDAGGVRPIAEHRIHGDDGPVGQRPALPGREGSDRPLRAGPSGRVGNGRAVPFAASLDIPESLREVVRDDDVVGRQNAAPVFHRHGVADIIPDLRHFPVGGFRDVEGLVHHEVRNDVGKLGDGRLVAHHGDLVVYRDRGERTGVDDGPEADLAGVSCGNRRNRPGNRPGCVVVRDHRPRDSRRRRRAPVDVDQIHIELVGDHHVGGGSASRVAEGIRVGDGDPRGHLSGGVHGLHQGVPEVGDQDLVAHGA